MTEKTQQDFLERINKANKSDMIVIVYDIALEYIEEGSNALKEKNVFLFKKSVAGAMSSINDLINALNYEYEISNMLFSLYNYVKKELLRVKLTKDISHFNNIKKVLVPLRQAFSDISVNDNSGSMINKTQHVVAGMTYGRGILNESIVNEGNSKTFSV